MTEVDFESVRDQWMAAGGKDTGGIIDWFAPPFVERWDQTEIRAGEVADLRFIGAEAGGRWAEVTGGSNRVGDLQLAHQVGFSWEPDWLLVCVRDPESGDRVLIDGNERASRLQAAVGAGEIAADQPVRLATGDVHLLVALVSKALSGARTAGGGEGSEEDDEPGADAHLPSVRTLTPGPWP